MDTFFLKKKFIVKRGGLNLDSLYKGQEAIVPSYKTPN